MTVQLIRHLFPKVALGTLLLAAAGCKREAALPPPPPPAVTVAPVQVKDVVEWEEFTGRVEPVESVDVRPRVSGYIQAVRFQSGQLVKKGDVLFIIDPRWHQATFDQRQAEHQQAKVRLENAKREADRTPQLLTNKAISVEESDARQARYEEAKART
jgi:RND family efflux transporter MFP subunit